VDRLAEETAVCHTGRHAIVASWGPHLGEENCLRGWSGSGTIFFSFCNLRCQFCQNWDISQKHAGREMDAEAIAQIMIHLQENGCHNINFVTPEHVVPQVLEATLIAIEQGLKLPIVYNTGGYDSLHSLSLMEGVVDIYMPDFKFWKPETALRLASAKDYPETVRQAIHEMHRQVGALEIGADRLARRGILVRHLVMPGQTDEAQEIFNFLANEISPDTYINVMGQYSPAHKASKFSDINRRPSQGELFAAHQLAEKAGLHRFAN
jgi:putative pyruvate formate lyase activating enzyme